MHMAYQPYACKCRYCDRPVAALSDTNMCARCVMLCNAVKLNPEAAWKIVRELVLAIDDQGEHGPPNML